MLNLPKTPTSTNLTSLLFCVWVWSPLGARGQLLPCPFWNVDSYQFFHSICIHCPSEFCNTLLLPPLPPENFLNKALHTHTQLTHCIYTHSGQPSSSLPSRLRSSLSQRKPQALDSTGYYYRWWSGRGHFWFSRKCLLSTVESNSTTPELSCAQLASQGTL